MENGNLAHNMIMGFLNKIGANSVSVLSQYLSSDYFLEFSSLDEGTLSIFGTHLSLMEAKWFTKRRESNTIKHIPFSKITSKITSLIIRELPNKMLIQNTTVVTLTSF